MEVELLSRHSLEHIDERLCSSCTGVVVPLESDLRKNCKIFSEGLDVNGGHDLRLTTGDLPRVTSKSKKIIEPARPRVKTKCSFFGLRGPGLPPVPHSSSHRALMARL